MAVLKRREAFRKADAKRAEAPQRKEDKRKADRKRAEDHKRKEDKRKADRKRTEDPKRKETVREAGKKYAQTLPGKWSKYLAREKYRENLGITRRRAQYRKYQQTKIDKARGGDAVMRRIKFQKGVLRGPEYVCSCCHRSLYKKSVTSVTEKMKEKIRLASEEFLQNNKQHINQILETRARQRQQHLKTSTFLQNIKLQTNHSQKSESPS